MHSNHVIVVNKVIKTGAELFFVQHLSSLHTKLVGSLAQNCDESIPADGFVKHSLLDKDFLHSLLFFILFEILVGKEHLIAYLEIRFVGPVAITNTIKGRVHETILKSILCIIAKLPELGTEIW